MPEKEPPITFVDRRKISSEGEIRPEANTPEPPREEPKAAAPGPVAVAPRDESAEAPAPPEGPTAQETAESHAAYNETTQQLDELLRSKAPAGTPALGPVGFEHLIQSMYMTAMMALGAGTQPGEKPRIDIMGARQTIDLLAVLGDKTRGNLNPDEQRLLESALFELRMMFLEITNAIARGAANPNQTPPPGIRK